MKIATIDSSVSELLLPFEATPAPTTRIHSIHKNQSDCNLISEYEHVQIVKFADNIEKYDFKEISYPYFDNSIVHGTLCHLSVCVCVCLDF